MYVFQLFDAYSGVGTVLLLVVLGECLAIGWLYGNEHTRKDAYHFVIRTPAPAPAKAVVNYLLQEKLSRRGRKAEQIGFCLSESSNLMSIQVSLLFFKCKSLVLLQNIHYGISMKFVEQPCAF